jgi:hypothetical protein
MVMEPTDFWHGNHLPTLWWLDWLRLWAIHCHRQMGTKAMAIGKVTRQGVLQMPLV